MKARKNKNEEGFNPTARNRQLNFIIKEICENEIFCNWGGGVYWI